LYIIEFIVSKRERIKDAGIEIALQGVPLIPQARVSAQAGLTHLVINMVPRLETGLGDIGVGVFKQTGLVGVESVLVGGHAEALAGALEGFRVVRLGVRPYDPGGIALGEQADELREVTVSAGLKLHGTRDGREVVVGVAVRAVEVKLIEEVGVVLEGVQVIAVDLEDEAVGIGVQQLDGYDGGQLVQELVHLELGEVQDGATNIEGFVQHDLLLLHADAHQAAVDVIIRSDNAAAVEVMFVGELADLLLGVCKLEVTLIPDVFHGLSEDAVHGDLEEVGHDGVATIPPGLLTLGDTEVNVGLHPGALGEGDGAVDLINYIPPPNHVLEPSEVHNIVRDREEVIDEAGALGALLPKHGRHMGGQVSKRDDPLLRETGVVSLGIVDSGGACMSTSKV
jgi:hypothetical protein